jgi:predicted Rossmann fold nucleotide-binding protein DprA/Smf involved in DNA uptake
VVPHNIDSANGRGGNALLKTHQAEPILSPDDVLALLRLEATPTAGLALDGEAALCWHALKNGARDGAAIALETGLPLRQVSSVLALLEIDGLVSFDAAGHVHPAVGLG